MKKIAASLGLLAAGASALHAAESSALNSQQATKAWSVNASLRGFYDDNISTQPNNKTHSLGFELNPSIDFGMPGEQTSFDVGYAFSAKYFDKLQTGVTDHWSYTHTFDALLNHTFSPRLDLTASESFAIGQEPDFLRAGNAASATTQRISGDNIRNNASISLNIEATELLGFNVVYNNTLFNYKQKGPLTVGPLVTDASNSGLFDRMEHAIHVDSQWKISPQTMGIVGYMYSQTGYTADEPIAGIIGNPASVVTSDSRDSRGHTFYVGAQQVFSPTLSATVKVGAQRVNYINDPVSTSQWSPYVSSSLKYLLQTTTSVDAGFTYSRSAANETGYGGNSTSFVRDVASAVVYGSIRHELVAHLFVSGNAMLERAEYSGGTLDGKAYLFYQLGLDLSYEFSPNLSTHVGYNYDKYDSDLAGRSYDRNRVYLGVTAGF